MIYQYSWKNNWLIFPPNVPLPFGCLLELLPVLLFEPLHHGPFEVSYPFFDSAFKNADIETAPTAELRDVVDVVFHPACAARASS
jgi:hypothetical protein